MIYKKLNKKLIDYINSTNNKIIIAFYNTKSLNTKLLNCIKNNNCYFKIYGGIKDIKFQPRYEKRIVYSLLEMKKIILCFEELEKNIPIDKLNKIIYIYNYIRKNINYYPTEENDLLIRSLRIIYTKHAVCSGYSLLFKELLERQNINCKYIKHLNHIWNYFYLDRKMYEVDLTWDSCVYKLCPSSNLHYFSNNRKLNIEHSELKKCNNYLDNNLLKTYELFPITLVREDNSVFKLILLPIGLKRKYYLYEDSNIKKIICSDDDFEIIYSRLNTSIVSSYVNCFFTVDRINKYEKKGISYLGYGKAENNCFYRKKYNEEENYILNIEYKNNDIFIKTINGNYLINNSQMMEV